MKLKRFTYFFCLVLMASACKELKGPEKPKNLISKKKMVNILIDAKLIGSAGSLSKRTMRDSSLDINTYVFKKYNIDSLQFALSNDYYAFHLNDYEEIYNKVTDSLEALKKYLKEQEAQKWKAETKQREDSLKAIVRDSTDLKLKDSLNIKIKRDSLIKNLPSKEDLERTRKLIKPVSDSVLPL